MSTDLIINFGQLRDTSYRVERAGKQVSKTAKPSTSKEPRKRVKVKGT